MAENSGPVCRNIRRWFRGVAVSRGLVKLEGCPCWVLENSIREYVPERSVDRIMVGMSIKDTDMIGGNRRISPNRLIDGGADMLAAHAKNHQRVVVGNRANRPLVR